MSGSFLLDSNIVIALFSGDPKVKEQMATADEVFISATVLGELYFGARNSTRPAQNIARIEEFSEQTTVLACDEDTARDDGIIKADLKKKGRPIPDNDIWIAASARQFDLVVSSRDDHFNAVTGLRVEAW